MRQITRKGLITVAAAGGVFAVSGGAAHADSSAHGAAQGSPGVLSGNTVQIPVHVPANICGNTVDVIGLLNPAVGVECVNGSSGGYADGGSSSAGSGSTAQAATQGSGGVASGNVIQAPVHVPVNVCGNSANVVGVLNPAGDTACGNNAAPARPSEPGQPGQPSQPGEPSAPGSPSLPEAPAPAPQQPGAPEQAVPEAPEQDAPAAPRPQAPVATEDETPAAVPVADGTLAETGTGMGAALPLGAGLLAGGFVLYRRGRAAQRA